MSNNLNYFSDEVLKVKNAIEKWIEDKQLHPGSRLPSQSKFVKMLKCSHSTVHKAMQALVSKGVIIRKVGHGTFLSLDPASSSSTYFDKFEEKINISPLYKNLNLKRDSVSTILFCSVYNNLPPLNSPAHEVLATAENKLYHSGKSNLKARFIQVKTFDEFEEKINNIKPDGLIVDWEQIEETSFSPLLIEALAEKKKIPAIHCFHYCKKEYSLKRIVEINNSEIGIMGLSYLHSLGHNNIMLIATEVSHGFDEIRINAAIDYATAYKINVHTFKYKNGKKNEWMAAGEAAYLRFKNIEESQRPTAIFAINDKTALAFIKNALKDGIKIPEDISVIGVDNEISAYLETGINLTSIDPCRSSIGENAANWMIEILNGNDSQHYSTVIKCNPKLIERQTTMYIKNGGKA